MFSTWPQELKLTAVKVVFLKSELSFLICLSKLFLKVRDALMNDGLKTYLVRFTSKFSVLGGTWRERPHNSCPLQRRGETLHPFFSLPSLFFAPGQSGTNSGVGFSDAEAQPVFWGGLGDCSQGEAVHQTKWRLSPSAEKPLTNQPVCWILPISISLCSFSTSVNSTWYCFLKITTKALQIKKLLIPLIKYHC